MCRHTVGLNDRSIGIEHVGYSDAEILGAPGAAARIAAPHALAPGPLRDPPARRHRPRREPVEPLPPRARRAPAHPDARRLRAPRDAPLPGEAMSEVVLVRHGETEWSRLGAAHRQHRHPAHRGRARRRRARSSSGSPTASSRSCSARRCSARAGPPSWPATASGPSSTTTCASATTATTRGSPPRRSARRSRAGTSGATRWSTARRWPRSARAPTACSSARSPPTATRSLFAHSHLLRTLGARWIGLGPEGGGKLTLGTAAICVLGFERERRVLKRWNWT